MKNHSIDGENMIKTLECFKEISVWIGQHHEKLNGVGYPRGLKEEEICFEAQILTVADIYTALRESRPYRRSLCFDTTKKIMYDMVEKGELNRDIVDNMLMLPSRGGNISL